MAPGSEAIVYLSSAPYGHPRVAHSLHGDRPFSRDVPIPGSGAGTAGVHPRFHNRGHAEHRRIATIARTVGSCAPLALGGARLCRWFNRGSQPAFSTEANGPDVILPGLNGSSWHLMHKMLRANYETSLRSKSSARPITISQRMPALVFRSLSLDGPKRCERCRWKTVESLSYPNL